MFPFLKRKIKAHELGVEVCQLFVGSDEGQTSFQNFLFWFKLHKIDHKRVYVALLYLRLFAAQFAVQMTLEGSPRMGAILDAFYAHLWRSAEQYPAGFVKSSEMGIRLSMYTKAVKWPRKVSAERAVVRVFAELSGSEMDFWMSKAGLEFSATFLAVTQHLESVRIV